MRRLATAAILLALTASNALAAPPREGGSSFVVAADALALVPIADSASLYRTGFGADLTLEYSLLPYLSPFVRAGTSLAKLQSDTGLVFAAGSAGLAFSYKPSSTLVLSLEGSGGLVSLSGEALSGTTYENGATAFGASARIGAGLRVHPAVTLFASGGITSYFGLDAPFYTAIAAGLSASFNLGSIGKDSASVEIRSMKVEPVFPVFYSYYDDHPFGSIVIGNGEDSEIRDVQVSFFVGAYMDRPKTCASYDSLAKGASVEAPLSALFNDGVLTLTEGATVRGEVVVEYRHVGAKRRVTAPVEMRMHHRNAMNWLDDRRAAAFASPKDPASLWFSRFVSGVVRDRLRGDIDRNLQFAIGLFETERLFGLSYVVDPASSYVEKSANEATVDYLQFPHQTLFYRGGDCDDLTILYTSLLQSLGIETAFITIPGHIFMAFSLSMTEAQARAEFYDLGLLAFRDGKAWVPVEITMVKEGFVKAWRVGAKEWQDNQKLGSAAMYPLSDAWREYPSVGIPDVNPRFTLPSEADVVQAFDMSLDRYIVREIEPQIRDVKARLASGPSIGAAQAASPNVSVDAAAAMADPADVNDLGIIYGRYGMLKEAWTQFSASAKAGFQPGWTNLANVAFLRKDYKLALSYYEYARKIDPLDTGALLGLARSYYELERFAESEKAYSALKQEAPELASRYGYLASMFGGEGRAWSFSDRLAATHWARKASDSASAEPSATPFAAKAPTPQGPASSAAVPTATPPAGTPADAAPAVIPGAAISVSPNAVIPQAEPPAKAATAEPVEPQKVVAPEAPAVAAAPSIAAAPAAEQPAVAETPPPETPVVVAAPPDTVTPAAAAELAVAEPVPDETLADTRPLPAEEPPAAILPPAAPVVVAAPPDTVTPAAAEPPVAESTPVAVPAPLAAESTEALAVGDSGLPMVAVPPLAQGFLSGGTGRGQWETADLSASQLDAKEFFAKLVIPAEQRVKPHIYRFSARSTGKSWVGVGLHILVDGAKTHRGYGEGRSLLVWLTYDPVHFKKDRTRLQLYRSYDDVNMSLIAETPVGASIYDMNDFEISVDPADGKVTVALNGEPKLRAEGLRGMGEGAYVVFRALDRADFAGFRVEATEN